MEIVICLLIGYLAGSFNPAALLSRRKQIDLRQEGTGNLGASNAMLVMGKKYGALVMAFDILKAYLVSKAAKVLFPRLYVADLLAGFASVVGHVFPFHLKFKGGKGLAAFGGMVLAYDPVMFILLLCLGLLLMLAVNCSFVMPMSAAALFPILTCLKTHDFWITVICVAASALVICKHWSNIGKALRGEDVHIREFLREKIFSRRHS